MVRGFAKWGSYHSLKHVNDSKYVFVTFRAEFVTFRVNEIVTFRILKRFITFCVSRLLHLALIFVTFEMVV